ncbi:MAG TPA: hypothetical protein VGW37_00290 [Terriglobia bacterium]|nr:hypothetical protein [Terriglobia bacterium]
MKTIRGLMTLAGLSVMLLALGATGAKGQANYSTRFAGTFTLPFEAQWGRMTLPAGDYALQYGLNEIGHGLVLVRGAAKGSPYGSIMAGPLGETSAKQNAIICVRDGNALIVRALEMPAIGKSVDFALPPGAKLAARNGKHSGYTQLAEAPMLIQRIPVTLNTK